jgi:arginine-tRNA-protein transferase
MIFLKDPQFSKPVKCPYIEGNEFIQEYFYAYGLNEREFDDFLSAGWRRFGLFFFRPACRNCRLCVPIRIQCSEFQATKSQRRVLKRNENTTVKLSAPSYSDEIYELYRKHSKVKFGQDSDVSQFKDSFFMSAVPSAQSEYYIEGKLIGVGFLDISLNALSSVYFIYDPDYKEYSPGTFSILKEIEIVKELKLPYYNLGYWIKENKRMSYKGRFSPFQTYHWEKKVWIDGDCYSLDDSEDVPDKKSIETQ